MTTRKLIFVKAAAIVLFASSDLAAQALNPPYLREMPSVERVLSDQQNADMAETAARQMGALLQLKKMIEDAAGPRFFDRRVGLTSDETRICQDYYTAYYRISQSKEEFKKFTAMRGYDIDPRFRDELFKRYFSPAFRAQTENANAAANGRTQARLQADKQAAEAMMKGPNSPAPANQANAAGTQATNAVRPTPPKNAEERAMRRCISSGRLPATCTGNQLLGAFSQMVGQVLPSAAKEPPPGPEIAGVFEGAGGWRLDFIDGGVLVNCSVLAPDQHSYTFDFKNNRATIVIDTTPRPLVLTLGPDGTNMNGPGPVQLDGVIVTGYDSGLRDASGRPVGAATATGPVYDNTGQRVSRTANTGHATFGSKRVTCPALSLSSKGAGVGVQTMQTDVLKSLFNDGDKGPPTPPGIRMHGIFAASTGFSVQFFPESVIVGCGPDSARAYPYTVSADGTRAGIKIDAPDHPFTLAFAPNGSLDPGSGTYQVHGRIVVGQNGDGDFTFAPLEQTCKLDLLAPRSLSE